MTTLRSEYIKLKEELFPEKISFELFKDFDTSHKVVAKRYNYPFTHVAIENFLPEDKFVTLNQEYKNLLDKGPSTEGDADKFSRFDLYDLYSFTPKPSLSTAYRFFYSESYFQMLENLFRVKLSRDTFLTYHHHEPSKEDNYIHNDFVFGCFADDPLPNGVNVWYKNCSHTEKPSRPDVHMMVRAIAVIYYLNNHEWEEKLGGETGIFETRAGGTAVRKLPPINNNLSAFEITPWSWHNFMKNNSLSRNSIAQWFFISPEDAKRRFPNEKFGGW